MRCVLNTRATFYALLLLTAVIAAIQVIDPPEDTFHMAADDLAARINSLREWYSLSSPDAAVTTDSIQLFLNELAEVHFMPPVAGDGMDVQMPLFLEDTAQCIWWLSWLQLI